MRKIALLSASLAAMLVALLPAAPAQALNFRYLDYKTFVSSTGSGTACTRVAPCSDLQAAHDATHDQGEINVTQGGSCSSRVAAAQDYAHRLRAIEFGKKFIHEPIGQLH